MPWTVWSTIYQSLPRAVQVTLFEQTSTRPWYTACNSGVQPPTPRALIYASGHRPTSTSPTPMLGAMVFSQV